MRSNRINYIVVGLFVIAVVVGLIVSVTVLTGRTGATDPYVAYYRNVTGVKFGTQVMYEGFPIGQVEKVTPEAQRGGMRFRVDFAVAPGWRIPEDSVAEIAAPGLLSAITISIRTGQSEQALKPGDEVKSLEAANLFAVMSSVAGDINDLAQNRLKPLLETLDRTARAAGQILESDGPVMVRNLAALAQDMAERAPRIADDVQVFTAKMNRSSDELAAFLSPANRRLVEETVKKLDAAATNLDALVISVAALLEDNREGVGKSVSDLRFVADSLARHIDSINQNMEGTARNMYEFSRQIRQNPGLLLGSGAPADEAKR